MTPEWSGSTPFRPLSTRVVGWVLLYSVAFTAVMTVALVGLHYWDERNEAQQQLHFAAENYRKSLASSLWELDMPTVRLQLDAIANFPVIGQAELTTSIGQTIRAGRYREPITAIRDAPSLEVPLISPDHPDHVVGHLRLYIDQSLLWRQLESDALRILGAEAIKGFVFGMLLAWLIAKLVTRHVSHIAQHVAALQPASLGTPLSLHRQQQSHHDELDQLTEAINLLHRRLHQYIATQTALEAELREHRDCLSEMVGTRTASLERLQGFHGLVIRVLTDFINLPRQDALPAVDQALGIFASYFGATRCLLLTQERGASGFIAVNAWPAACAGNASTTSPQVLPPIAVNAHGRLWVSTSAGMCHDDGWAAFLGDDTYTVLEIDVKDSAAGRLCLTGRAIGIDSDDARLLELAARVVSTMLNHQTAHASLLHTQHALQRVNEELQILSRNDPLTGLANRRHFDDVKDAEFRRAIRANLPLSVLMCDIDQFKRYNDTYGHAQGDACLIAVSACLPPLFGRAGELMVRLGGEEFAVLLPNTTGEQAALLAERLRQAVWALNLPHAASSVAGRVTISIGVASRCPALHADFDALLEAADRALYQAKDRRNRVVLA